MSLEVLHREHVCELHLDAPPGNVLDTALCVAIEGAVREHAHDPHLKAFLFTATGKHFSFGASVPEHEPGKVERFLPQFHRLFLALAGTGVPAIAAVKGLCLGGAMELVAFCPFVLAEESAEFAVPEVSLGVIPPIACLLLPWRIGGAAAEELVLTGRRMKADEALRRGLVQQVSPAGKLDEAVEAFLRDRVRPLSAAALRLATRAVRAPLAESLRERLPALERLYLDEVMATRDAREGIRAFLEKRKPSWTDA